MGQQYANVNDIISRYRALTEDEAKRAEALIPTVCARLRIEAKKAGEDLDIMIALDSDLGEVAKQITVDVVARALMTPTANTIGALSQYSQSGLGYTESGTFLSPGGGLFIKKAELAALGIKRQKCSSINLMGESEEPPEGEMQGC